MADPAQVMELPIARQLLRDEPILHLSYTARDGGPRVIPIGYVWDGARFLMWTVPDSAKVGALRADERVAITIDVMGQPPRVLLVRGRAALETVDGVPDGYLEASHRTLPPEAWEGFDTQVRALYKQMTVITVTPDWARLLDFETTAPAAVEKLMRQQGQAPSLLARWDTGPIDLARWDTGPIPCGGCANRGRSGWVWWGPPGR